MDGSQTIDLLLFSTDGHFVQQGGGGGGGRSSYFIKGHNGEHFCEVILLLGRLVEQEKMLFKVIVFNVQFWWPRISREEPK